MSDKIYIHIAPLVASCTGRPLVDQGAYTYINVIKMILPVSCA